MPSTATTPTLTTITEAAKPHLEALDDFLLSQVDCLEAAVRPMAHYALSHAGKRLRPILVFFSGKGPLDSVSESLVKAAAILEMIHLATLIHDDILDEAQMRHGCASIPEAYGPKLAVLLGDALFSHALVLAAEFPTTAVCQLASRATRNVCSGEILQTLDTERDKLSLDRYWKIVDLKTAALFAASCELGAYLGGQDPRFIEAATVFGRELGLAYQIYDDLTDLWGSEADIGKTLGTDISQGRYTLPILLWLETLGGPEKQSWVQEIEDGNASAKAIREAIETSGAHQKALQICIDRLDTGRAALAFRGHTPATEALLSVDQLLRAKLEGLAI